MTHDTLAVGITMLPNKLSSKVAQQKSGVSSACVRHESWLMRCTLFPSNPSQFYMVLPRHWWLTP